MKKLTILPGRSRFWKKLVLKMKLTATLFLFCLVSVSASTYSQNTRFDISVKNGSLVDLFRQIEEKSEFYFFFQKEEFRELKNVTVRKENSTVMEILDEALKGTGLSYKVVDRYIIVKKEGESAEKGAFSQQPTAVSGKVTDMNGIPLPGVSVVIKGTTSGTITDVNGNYSIPKVSENAVLLFSFVGMKMMEIAVAGKTTIYVKMEEETIGIEEVVAIGYGTQKKSDLTGAVAFVKGEELVKSKTASLSNSLAGRLPGVVSRQTSGEPGKDAASISIRGFGTTLLIVDGIERDFNKIDPEEIETFTILKDASAAIYGARAGNGVILITTKRGNISKPAITLNSTYTLQGLTRFPRAVNSSQYAELMNENAVYNGQNPIYSQDAIKKYYDNSDPQNYPNTDWWSLVMKDWAPQLKNDLSMRGGNERIKYYNLVSYLNQGGMWKSGDNMYNRYNLRSNIDAVITKDFHLTMDLSIINEDLKSPIRPIDFLFQDFYDCLPTYPGVFPDPSKVPYGGSSPQQPIAATTFDLGGYRENQNTQVNTKLSMVYMVPFIKGFSFEGFGSHIKYRNDYKNFYKQYTVYQFDPASDSYINKGSVSPSNLSQGFSTSSVFTLQFSGRYNRTFNEKHNLNVMLLYERIDENGHNLSAYGENFLTSSIDYMFAAGGEGQKVGGTASEDGRVSYVGRLNYDYKGRYLFQSTMRYDGSPRFYSSNQWGFFPSFSCGWRISEENFIKNKFTWLDNLKLRSSFSQLGYDAIGKFQYLTGYQITTGTVGPFVNPGYVIGGIARTSIGSTGLANPDITWEKMTIYNLGLDVNIHNSGLYSEIDFFYRQREDMLATKILSLPNTFGASLPPENLNSLNNRGFEILIGHKSSVGALKYHISGNVSWTRAKWDHYEEPEYTDPDDIRIRKQSGNWANRTFSYKSDGIFTSQEEIKSLGFDQDGKGNTTLAPGDIRFVDINKDGKLDWRDQINIGGNSVPELMFGLTLETSFKGFELSMLWQGAGRSLIKIQPHPYIEAAGRTPYELTFKNRWTGETNNPDSELPRFGSKGFTNNSRNSDFWTVDGTYMRLKNAMLSYSLPVKLINRIGLEKVSLFVTGTNLLTFSALNKWSLDAEVPDSDRGWYYPQQKTISSGISITF